MHTQTLQWTFRQLAVQLLGTFVCCVSITAHAAKADQGQLLAQASTGGTRLGHSVTRRAPEPIEEECEDEEEDEEEELILTPARRTAAAPSRTVAPVRAAAAAPATAVVAGSYKAAADAPAKPKATWEVRPSDKTLQTSLARWAAAVGWQLVWELPVDYKTESRSAVTGTFEEAVAMVVKSMENAEVPMKAIFYEGNKVLRIVAKGN
jgi:hypothetical protein